MSYADFLRAKVDFDRIFGFEVAEAALHPVLLPHQRDIVRWALLGGRRALFEAFGLGKSVQQLEIMRHIAAKEGGRQLIVCPLGVRGEFAHDAVKLLGMAPPTFVRFTDDVDGDGLYITNYESVRDGRLDPTLFNAVTLDEAGILRSFGSKTYDTFLPLFKDVPYRFVATATPSPNRYKELIHYGDFLGIMEGGEALTRFFQRTSEHANHLTLMPHREAEFWLWLSSWAMFLQRPSDIGYSDDGYDLPPLDIRWHEVPVEHTEAGHERTGQHRMFRDASLGVSEAAAEHHRTLEARVAVVKQLVDEAPDDHFVVWHDLTDERRALEKAIPAGVSIHGTLDLDERERRIVAFSEGRERVLLAKPVLAGVGCNFQYHCHRAIFAGVGFRFHDFIQACHRVHRFQQSRPVRIDIVYAASERSIVEVLKRKWAQHDQLTEKMSVLIREHGLSRGVTEALQRSMGVDRQEERGDGWTLVLNDTVDETAQMAPTSVDEIVTSIPFGTQYQYVASVNDFGFTDDNAHFWRQMDFLTPELLRVLRPGRVYACHVKDRIRFGARTGAGYSQVEPFHAEAILHNIRHGFEFLGMITVVTDVVRENNQSYRLGWSENAKDGTKMGVGTPEYVLLFRKPQTDRSRGYADVPVVHDKAEYSRARWQVDAHAFWRSSGNRIIEPDDLLNLTADQRTRLFHAWSDSHVYDHEQHVALGEDMDHAGVLSATYMMLDPTSWHPDVWTDVVRMRTLNLEQSRAREMQHTCPLQLTLVERLVRRFSNPGELVYDPFAGLGSVPLVALQMGRQARGTELSEEYWHYSVRYLRQEEARRGVPTLFDLELAVAEGVTA